MEKNKAVNGREEIKATNILKGIAIWFVIINHVGWITEFDKRHFSLWIYVAVSIFVVITGYHYALSMIGLEDVAIVNGFEESYTNNILKWYSGKKFFKKILKVLVPYSIMFIIWLIYRKMITGNFLTGGISQTVSFFLRGGTGPGGYYTPVILQFLVIFPCFYFLIKKDRLKGAFLVLFLAIHYEFLRTVWNFSSEFYRIFFFRLAFALTLGILLQKYYHLLKSTCIPHIMFMLGFIFLLGMSYLQYKPQTISSWTSTSYAAAPYAFSIVYFFLRQENFFKRHSANWLIILMEYVGKASYCIMLTQQLYFTMGIERYFKPYVNNFVLCVIDIVLCTVVGVGFFRFSSWGTNWIFDNFYVRLKM